MAETKAQLLNDNLQSERTQNMILKEQIRLLSDINHNSVDYVDGYQDLKSELNDDDRPELASGDDLNRAKDQSCNTKSYTDKLRSAKSA